MNNLPAQNFFDLDFYKLFASKGFRIKSAVVMRDKYTQKSLCYGYLNFDDWEEADRCLTEMNNTQVLDRSITLTRLGDNKNVD